MSVSATQHVAPVAAAGEIAQGRRWRLYRAVWRWHFYAGLLVLPFIAWLALTGAAFLYHDAIDRTAHQALKVVPVGPARLPAQQLVDAAQRAQAGTVFRYTTPDRADASAEIGVLRTDGAREVVYVDPYSGRALGMLPEHGTLAWTIRRLHSLDLLGPLARGLIEMAAGWAIVLVLTGVYLWWPRGRRSGVVSVRGRPAQRVFWRDLHAVTGAGFGAVLLFLALTGMPWSWLWGAQVNRWVNGHDFGYPAGLRVQLPMSQQRLTDSGEPSWSLRQARLPQSTLPPDRPMPMPMAMGAADAMAPAMAHAARAAHPEHNAHAAHAAHVARASQTDTAHAEHAAHGGGSGLGEAPGVGALGLDAALARFDARGIAAGYSVAVPRGASGVYTASVYPDDLQRQRVIHLDQYSGAVLLDMRYRDYGPLAQALEWGINVHLGQQYGTANQLLLLLACAAIVLLCVSAAVMWWKRRPVGGLGVPPLPADPRTLRGVLALLVLCGLLFPLMGASLLLLWAFDHYWSVRRLRR
ncbi:PepSY-associated TM helix domain-containing protein [Xanthomonas campestris]|uniref:PepSY-associated TM helix domain-containing protein n=1 Tax=Xanthomonas campestris TaxID=339 RepID=UPI0023671547|nr:PepSY domain-containing protein [Xanthomonas campestris]MEA9782434.1 PepSY domain-containing protein [Xanthomonas campestris pv. raphani]MEA9789785.1 PepSY domain-containing protein [Xanthomonas campestris pv. raphani]MEA9803094.1 PepSY domain-containing protein [Xanthomonas campestris pv. raphani]MEA9817922.1 PepSY domain-containing protein [Xanthomonas campestris pv. raphani]MEA9870899.1 PepSY domain-containing protein [Xanthomonas campestris pv. raphani]